MMTDEELSKMSDEVLLGWMTSLLKVRKIKSILITRSNGFTTYTATAMDSPEETIGYIRSASRAYEFKYLSNLSENEDKQKEKKNEQQ
jgi:hypothetical protein